MLLLVFSITLLVAVLLSDLADRSILATSMLFLFSGAVCSTFGIGELSPHNDMVRILAEVALVIILFTDGMKTGFQELRTAWRLPGRALLFGLPLTLLFTAILVKLVAGMTWLEAFLVAAVLSPTDPVFAAALIGNKNIPKRLRHLLNVESGLNDGLAVPIVLGLLSLTGSVSPGLNVIAFDVGMGVVIGIVIPWTAIRLERTRFFAAARVYRPLFGFSILLVVFSTATIFGFNQFLAAFSAGVTVASTSTEVKEHFQEFGELLAELLKLVALFIFGRLISLEFFRQTLSYEYIIAALILILARPVAMAIALIRSTLTWEERVAAAWFGPKGFASVVFGLMVLSAMPANSLKMFHLIALVVATSMIVHSASDVPVTRWLTKLK